MHLDPQLDEIVDLLVERIVADLRAENGNKNAAQPDRAYAAKDSSCKSRLPQTKTAYTATPTSHLR